MNSTNIDIAKTPSGGPASSDPGTARSLYRKYLRTTAVPIEIDGRRIRGIWKPDPELTASHIWEAVEQALAHEKAQHLKKGGRINVVRTPLLGTDAVIKGYRLTGPIERLKYYLRPSRARRYWAAARTMEHLGIPTPEPLGYLEIYDGPAPLESYVFTRFIEHSVPSRRWIEPEFSKQPAAVRARLREDILEALLMLYRHGVYHRDTKLSNLLLQHPEATDQNERKFMWIDLECVQCGIAPTRHQVVRNLVQLNGSLGEHISEEDRCAFLGRLAKVYPWVTRPATIRKIRRWTARRLQKEQYA